jgi:hypothetical protein
MKPLRPTNPREASHTRRQRRGQENFCRRCTQMNADRPIWWIRDWLNSSLSHRHICVHLRQRSFSSWSLRQPDATRQGRGPAHPPPATPRPTVPSKPSRIDPVNREPTAKPTPTALFKPFRIDPLNREPTPKPTPTAPPVAGSNTSSAATAPPARAHGPAPRPRQLDEGSQVRAPPRGFPHPIALARPQPLLATRPAELYGVTR